MEVRRSGQKRESYQDFLRYVGEVEGPRMAQRYLARTTKRVASAERKMITRGAGLRAGADREFSFGQVRFEMPVGIQVQM